MWMDFETRMRLIIKNMLEPVLFLSIEDREK